MSSVQGNLFLPTEPPPEPRPAPPGLHCPKCKAVEASRTSWRTGKDGVRYAVAECRKCKGVVRRLGDGAQQPKYEPLPDGISAAAAKAPASTCEWIGWIRQGDAAWRPVALAATLEKCWDALLHYPGRGDLLCTPVKPGASPKEEPHE